MIALVFSNNRVALLGAIQMFRVWASQPAGEGVSPRPANRSRGPDNDACVYPPPPRARTHAVQASCLGSIAATYVPVLPLHPERRWWEHSLGGVNSMRFRCVCILRVYRARALTLSMVCSFHVLAFLFFALFFRACLLSSGDDG